MTETTAREERPALPALDPSSVPHVLGAIPEGLTVQDAAGRFVFVNEAAARLVGFSSADELLLGTPQQVLERFEVLDPQAIPAGLESLPSRAALRGEHPPPQIVGFRAARGGPVRWAVVTSTPVIEGGAVTLVVNVFREITDQRRSETALRFLADAGVLLASSLDHAATLGALAQLAVPELADWCAVDLVETSPVSPGSAASIRSRQLAVAHVDPAKVALAYELNQRYPPPPDAPTGLPNVLRTGKAELYPEITDEILAASAQDEEHLRVARELGLRSAMIVPLNARGRTLGAISFVSAESGRRFDDLDLACAEALATRAALALDNARLYEEAQRAVRSREETLAVVSHDLRNLLSSIVLGASALAERAGGADAGPAQTESGFAASAILRNASRMGDLINDLLDASTLEAGSLSLEVGRHAVDALMAEALDLVSLQAAQKSLQLVSQSACPAAVVTCDLRRVRQVFANLLANAVKHTPSGGTLSVTATPVGEEVEFALADTGPGIAAEHLSRIFDRYWQVKRGDRTGAGLGLYIARGILQAHGSDLKVESTEGQGTRFWFRLRLAPGAQEA